MDKAVFTVALVASSAAMALWLDTRFPRLAPQSKALVFGHLAVSALAIHTLVPSSIVAVRQYEGFFAIQASVLGIALPGLAYLLVASLWFLKLCRDMFTGGLR